MRRKNEKRGTDDRPSRKRRAVRRIEDKERSDELRLNDDDADFDDVSAWPEEDESTYSGDDDLDWGP